MITLISREDPALTGEARFRVLTKEGGRGTDCCSEEVAPHRNLEGVAKQLSSYLQVRVANLPRAAIHSEIPAENQ